MKTGISVRLFLLSYERSLEGFNGFIRAFVMNISFISQYSSSIFNPLVTNGLSHPYNLDESTFIFRGIRSDFVIFHIAKDKSVLTNNIVQCDLIQYEIM